MNEKGHRAPQGRAEDYTRAGEALRALNAALDEGTAPSEAAAIAGVLHGTLAATDEWSYAAMIGATRQAAENLETGPIGPFL